MDFQILVTGIKLGNLVNFGLNLGYYNTFRYLGSFESQFGQQILEQQKSQILKYRKNGQIFKMMCKVYYGLKTHYFY